MGGTGASTGEWLSLIKFITLLRLGWRRRAAHASEVAGRGVVEGDSAEVVSHRKRLSVGAERNTTDIPDRAAEHAPQFAGLSVVNLNSSGSDVRTLCRKH